MTTQIDESTNGADLRLERAKKAALELSDGGVRRQWITVESRVYGGDMYITRLHLLEGTPPRAYIIENAERNICTVLDADGNVFGVARNGGVYGPVRWVRRRRNR